MPAVESSLSNDILQTAIRRGLRNDNIVVTNVVTTKPPLSGDHYMSEVEYCDVDIDVDGTKGKVNLFVKKELKQEKQIENNIEIMSTSAFDTEIAFFDFLLRDIVDFCKKNETTPIDTDFFPLCFYTSKTEKRKLLALENLASVGYKMHAGRTRCQDLKHAKLVMTSLATVHAISYVMHEKTGVDFVQQYNLPNMLDGFAAFLDTVTPPMYKVAVNVLRNAPDCLALAGKLQRFAPHAVQVVKDHCHPGNSINVMCHGDCWNNNMFFLYDDNGEPIKIKLIDWQGTTSCRLFRDICTYIFGSLKPDVRRTSLTELLRTYYDQFSRVAQSLGAGDVMFSYDRFLEEYSASKMYALSMGLMTIVMNPVLTGVDKEKKEDSEKEFDMGYLLEHCQDPQLEKRLSQELKHELVELARECEQELDVFLSNV